MKATAMLKTMVALVLTGVLCVIMTACSGTGGKPPVENNGTKLVTIVLSGGYGTMFETLPVEYTVCNDATIHVSYDLSDLEEEGMSFKGNNEYVIKISDEQYSKITDALSKAHLESIEIISREGVLDGSSQSFIAYDENGNQIRRIGGYMVDNDELNELEKNVFECFDAQQRSEIKNMGNELEKEYNAQL